MRLNFKNDFTTICKYVHKRIQDYPKGKNAGPGKDNKPISMITLGYDFEGAGWISLVFDTRSTAKPDGEWNSYVEENCLEFSQWSDAFDKLMEKESPMVITCQDGSQKTFKSQFSMEELAKCFGKMMREVLITSRETGKFSSLKTTKDCRICVEHHEGAYGSVDFLDGRSSKKTEEERVLKLQNRLNAMTIRKQINYWVDQLDYLAEGSPCEMSAFLFGDEIAIKALMAIGEKAVLPLLNFTLKWSDQLEWNKDRPKRAKELPMSNIVFQVFSAVKEMGVANPKIEIRLLDFIRESVAVNQNRKLWGTNPYHAANCLHLLFPKYPEPKMDSNTNALLNPEDFIPR